MLIDKSSISKYIPQRAPFIMVDELITANETHFESQFIVDKSNLFLKNGLLSESALIENIAQTCAAGFGYVNSLKGDEAGKLGFIGSVSRVEVKDVAKELDALTTKVEVISTFDTIHLIEGKVYNKNSNELISCQMKIVVG
ncbi:MAG: hypothetical protein M9916_12720 [Crocinitomicaceae bacterium]|nr:hypothetical protein [Crocinitomicaceae bacterium]